MSKALKLKPLFISILLLIVIGCATRLPTRGPHYFEIENELPPMAAPEAWQAGYKRLLLINGKDASDTLISRTNDTLTFEESTGCQYTRREQTIFAPSINWRNCQGSDGSLTYTTKGDVWPLTKGKKWKYEVIGKNVKGNTWSNTRNCEVGKEFYHVKTDYGEWDTYKVHCTTEWIDRIYYVSPQEQTWVYYEKIHHKIGPKLFQLKEQKRL